MKDIATEELIAETSDTGEQVRSLLTRAWEWYRRDGVQAALYAEHARNLAQRCGDRSALIESLAALSLSQNQAGDFDGALSYAQEAVHLLEPDGEIRCIALQAFYSLGVAQTSKAQYNEARSQFEKALALAQRCGDQEREADVLADIALVHHRQGDFLRALDLLPQSLTIAEEVEYPFGQATALHRLGMAYDRIGEYGTALEIHLKALALRREIGDRLGEVSSLNNIGNVHIQLGEYPQALTWHEQGLALSREVGNLSQEAAILGNIGLSYQVLGDWPASVQYQRQALAIKEQIGERQGAVNTLGNLGSLLVLMGEYIQAEEYLSRALAGNRQMRDLHGEAHCLVAMGCLYERGKGAHGPEDNRDLVSLGIALERAKQTRSPELEYLVHEGFAKAYRARGDFECALTHFEEFHRLKEAVFTEQMASRTRLLQVRHEVEQAKKESEIHRLRTMELTEALVEADRLREMAERLAREDVLTGLLTRRYGEDRLSEAFARAQRYGRPLTVILADIDNFKRINDTCSHQVGDAVLKTIGTILRESCRMTDIVARFGGEEFLLALPEIEPSFAHVLCERVRTAVEQYNWESLGKGLRVTLSIGICDDTALSSHERMLSVADSRLYAAKNAGRNRIVA